MKGNITLADRSQGCLFGGAMGDAFGFPIEFKDLSAIRSVHGPQGLQEPILIEGRYRISDDTQMTLLTADGILLAYRRFCDRGIASDPYHYIYGRYRRWAELQGYKVEGENIHDSWLFADPAMTADRYPGTTCIRELCNNEYPATMEEPRNQSKGCGGLMRVAPIGLFCYDPVQAAEWGAQVAASTHGHPLGYMTAGFMSSLICHEMDGDSLMDCIEYARKDCCGLFEGDGFDDMCDLIDKATGLAGSPESDDVCMKELGKGWVAEETLAMALFSCLRHDDDVKGCLRCAVNVTGDSDSIGSVAGNIIGAYLGISKVREAFDIDKVECRDMIEETAEDILSFRLNEVPREHRDP